jgi:hypothetical protein
VTRRTLLAGIAALAATIGVAAPSTASPQAGAAASRPMAAAAPAAPTGAAAADAAAQEPSGTGLIIGTLLDLGVAVDDGPADGDVVRGPSGLRYGGEWDAVTPQGEQVHVLGLVGPTAEERAAIDAAAAAAGTRVVVQDVDHSTATLTAARDAVAERLRALGVGDFAVEVEPQGNRVMAHIEADGPMAHAVAGQAREAAAAATADAPRGTPEVAVAIESDVEVAPIGATSAGRAAFPGARAATLPPYAPGLPVDVTSPTILYHCTSAYTFVRDGQRLGSTAGHCGDVNARVTAGPNATIPVGTVVANGFHPHQEVHSDVALFSLPEGVPTAADVRGGSAGARQVEATVPDAEITHGSVLCFSGRASGDEQCGPVNAVGRYTCCDASQRAFVFDCIDQVARSGDSGGPVYQPVGEGRARAAGLLSSSVDINGRSSMCFTTIDDVARHFGAAYTAG